jgi:uncharacterized membrane protein YgdD (TMEM256/DUF423 family)
MACYGIALPLPYMNVQDKRKSYAAAVEAECHPNQALVQSLKLKFMFFLFPQSGSLLVLGMVLFCGTCYYHALTGNGELRWLTPVGGSFLIAGWLAMIL